MGLYFLDPPSSGLGTGGIPVLPSDDATYHLSWLRGPDCCLKASGLHGFWAWGVACRIMGYSRFWPGTLQLLKGFKAYRQDLK